MAASDAEVAAIQEPEAGFLRELRGLDIREIRSYLDSHCHQSFEQSELYVTSEERNVIDTTQRLSKFRKITDAKLFNLLEPLVARLSKEDPLLSYTLVRNDVTHIRYEKGGFFQKHTDYVSVSSNLLEEFSMLVCITPEEFALPDQGGKTVVHMRHRSHESDATTTPGCALAFRKDLEHEGALLKAGEKQVLMLNLWATRKSEGGMLLVSFRDAAEVASSGASRHGSQPCEDAVRTLHDLAREESYAIPITEAKRSSKLAQHIASSGLSGGASIARYDCEDCSYEAFGVIFKILRRMYVSAQEVEERADLIKLFGLDAQHILVAAEAAAAVPADEGTRHEIRVYMMDGSSHTLQVAFSDTVRDLKALLSSQAALHLPISGLALFLPGAERPLGDFTTVEGIGLPRELFSARRMTKVDEYQVLELTDEELAELPGDATEEAPSAALDDDEGGDVIVCESLERTALVARAAAAAGLPFLHFQALLVEGDLSIRGDTCRPCRHEFEMDPAFIMLGDSKQVFAWGSVNDEWDGNCRWWEQKVADRPFPSNPALFDLQRALKPETEMTAVMQTVFGMTLRPEENWDADDDEDTEESVAPFRSVMGLTAPAHFEEEGEGEDGRLFHVSAQGQTCFGPQEAAAASARLREILFIDQLKERVGKVPWQFPQSSESVRATLCNEQVYGHANIVLVSGVVRLSSGGQEEERREEHQRLRSRYGVDAS